VLIPDRIVISRIHLDAFIIPAVSDTTKIDGQELTQWLAPDQFAAGWHADSAPLGQPGNVVLNGHHNVHGEVFRDLYKLHIGDQIIVFSGSHSFVYAITNKMILVEKKASMQQRLENARWIEPSADDRLTLVTCWPYSSNSHRLVIVAIPLSR
jgi:LPXTG-site transpeptidase (sortase) family protein